MNISELIASYGQIDRNYEERFRVPADRHLSDEDRGGYVNTERKMEESYMSFIPNRNDAEEILLGPLRRMLENC